MSGYKCFVVCDKKGNTYVVLEDEQEVDDFIRLFNGVVGGGLVKKEAIYYNDIESIDMYELRFELFPKKEGDESG